MSEPSRSVARTAAALATRRRNTQAALGRVRDTIARLRREKAPITVAVVARRAGVSRTRADVVATSHRSGFARGPPRPLSAIARGAPGASTA